MDINTVFDKDSRNARLKIAAVIFGIILAVAVIFAIIFSGKGTTTIAFYDVEKNISDGIESIVTGMQDEKGKPLFKTEFVTLNAENPLSDELKTKSGKKADLIVTYDGLGLENLISQSKIKAAFEKNLIEGMTSSVQGSFSKEKKIFRLPILMDHLELTVDRSVMEETRTEAIASWRNIEFFCEKSRELMNSPIVFNGKDECFILDLIGAMCEVTSGQESYLKAVEMIRYEISEAEKKSKSSKNSLGSTVNYIKLAENLAEKKGAPLFDSISYLNKLYNNGYFSRETLTFTEDSVRSYMRANQAAVVIEYLSGHRKVPYDTIKRYSSTYLVSSIPAVHRYFVAPTVNVAVVSKNKGARKLSELFVKRNIQEQLTRATGLAPVLKDCMTPDKEADDVRYWVAATNSPSNGLSKDAFADKKQVAELSKVLMGYIVK